MTRPPFPIAIDSTMRGAFATCPQKFFREYFQHWKPMRESVDLVAGKAFAAGIETVRKAFWDENCSPDEALTVGVQTLMKEWGTFEAPEGHVKTLDRMVGALDEYFRQYGYATDHIKPHQTNGKGAIELSFAIPIPNTSHPETGDPILYTGRYDMIGEYNGSLFVIDEKTTKQLGQSWFKNWTLRGQITGYCWAAQEFGYPVAGAIIRGISILKTKYGHAESLQYRPQHMLDMWLNQLAHDVNRMIACWETNHWDYSFDSGCTMYGGCIFQETCSSANSQRVLEQNFVKRVWDPLLREEKEVKEDAGGN